MHKYSKFFSLSIKLFLVFLLLVKTLHSAPEDPQEGGAWGPINETPLIAVSAANLPDGRILMWASNERTNFRNSNVEFAFTAVWDPQSNTFVEIPHPTHDIFCAHQVILENGSVFVTGGRNRGNSPWTSIFNPDNNQWMQINNMNRGRWYPTSVALPNGTVMTALGAGGGNTGELWDGSGSWDLLGGINFNEAITDFPHAEPDWWPMLHVAPDGRIFHSGPTPDMHMIDPSGIGSITQTNTHNDWYPKHGTTVMYDEGKLLIAGGWTDGSTVTSVNNAMVVDLNNPSPQITPIAPMIYPRKHHSGVILPNGEVLVVGGNKTGARTSNSGSNFPVEIWNPDSQTWREGARLSEPRNYHSIGLLLLDGRVLASGGGLCDCIADHKDQQIYSPPYLFNPDGSPATRPNILSVPGVVEAGQTINVSATPGLSEFSLIKMSSATHAVNTDLRYLPVTMNEVTPGSYQLTLHSNINVLTPGHWMLFALNAQGTPSVAKSIRVSTQGLVTGPPSLKQMANMVSPLNEIINLTLVVNDPDGDTLSFSATGLPTGLSINASTGEITGTTSSVGDVFNPTITVDDGNGGVDSTSYTWTVAKVDVTQTFEFEIMAVSDSDGTTSSSIGFSDNSKDVPSRGQYYLYESNAVGEYVTFAITVNDIGVHTLDLRHSLQRQRGRFEVGVSNNVTGPFTQIGVMNDSVQSGINFPTLSMPATFNSVGTHYLRFSVAGAHPTTGSMQIGLDKLDVTFNGGGGPTNNPPTITTPGAQTNTEGDAVSGLFITADDIDGDTLSFSATGLPTGLSISVVSGEITGTTTTAGSFTPVVTVNDGNGGGASTNPFTWSVQSAGGGGPTSNYEFETLSVVDSDGGTSSSIKTSGAASNGQYYLYESNAVGEYVTFAITVNDVGVHTLDLQYSFSRFRGRFEVGVSNNVTGPFTQIGVMNDTTTGAHVFPALSMPATFNSVGTQYIRFTVIGAGSDGYERIGLDKLDVTFNGGGGPTNNPPTITTPGAQTNTEGDAVSGLFITADDIDGDTLEFMATGLPTGLMINAGSGEITGTTTMEGSFTPVVTVDDGNAGSASTNPFTWIVQSAGGNNPPTITTPGAQTNTEGDAVSGLFITADDIDGDTLSFSATGLPTGLSISVVSGEITGTTTTAGSFTPVVTVNDGNGGGASTNPFTWSVQSAGGGGPTSNYEFETLSVVDSDGGTSSSIKTSGAASNGQYYLYESNAVGEYVTFAITVNDVGVHTLDLQYSFSRFRGRFEVGVSNNVTGPFTQIGVMNDTTTGAHVFPALSMPATFNSVGTQYIRFTVIGAGSDGYERIGLDKLDVTFNGGGGPTNNPPTITTPGAQTNTEGDAVSGLFITADDIDGDTLSFSATGLPTGLSISVVSGEITGTTTTAGSFTPVVTVNDGNGGGASTNPFTWSVQSAGGGGPTSNYEFETLSVVDSDGGTSSSIKTSGAASNGQYYLYESNAVGEYVTFAITVNDVGVHTLDLQYSFSRFRGRFEVGVSNNVTGPFTQIGVMNDTTTGAHVFPALSMPATFNSVGTQYIRFTVIGAGSDGYERIGLDKLDVTFNGGGGPTNNPPTITTPGAQTNTEGDAVSGLFITADDIDGDTLSFSATGLPTGLSINAVSGEITGTTTAAGSFTPVVTVNDGNGGGASTNPFTWAVTQPSIALTIDPFAFSPVATGVSRAFTGSAQGSGVIEYSWTFGDGTTTPFSTDPNASHTYTVPGRYLVTLQVRNESEQDNLTVTQAVHLPIAGTPISDSTILYESLTGVDRVWNVNPDNDSVTVIDVVTQTKITEITTSNKPVAITINPNSSEVWVTNKGAATITRISLSTLTAVNEITLPIGSRPHGIVFDPATDRAFVALEALKQIVRINPTSNQIESTLDVPDGVKHLALAIDGSSLYVPVFRTPRIPGEDTATPSLTDGNGNLVGGIVNRILTSNLTLDNTPIVVPYSNAEITEHSAPGLPNYLRGVAISPDGINAYLSSKQDNILSGALRDVPNGQLLGHDSTVRAITSHINLSTGSSNINNRIDHDDASALSASTYGPFGSYLFVALEGARMVSVVDAFQGEEIFRFASGRAPQGITVSPDGQLLFVHNFLERTVSIHDVSKIILEGINQQTLLATVPVVASESLATNVLLGKQHFYDALDPRLSLESYMSCAICHNDGGHDGRIWDFTQFGEGLRNTISLNGQAGTTRGPIHWTGNFDEIQDFEAQIRNFAGGSGLMNNSDFIAGTRAQPLGDTKAGFSNDLDALAAYVNSLTAVPTSPYRAANGQLTANAQTGKQLFADRGCASCHSGDFFSDSTIDTRHDIGTIDPTSGNRLGAILDGFDTPTLKGLWLTNPYLHDGAADTITEAILAHTNLPMTVTSGEVDLISEYLMQADEQESAPPSP